MLQKNSYSTTSLPMPNEESIPVNCREILHDLFDTWHSGIIPRNRRLTQYYEMKNDIKDFGIAIPPQLSRVNEVVGWAAKAVDVRAVRSHFDGFVFDGYKDNELNALVAQNKMYRLVSHATRSCLVHGCSAMTVMKGGVGQPAAKVRAFSANQCCMLHGKDADDIVAGIVLADVDRENRASRYVVHLPDRVLTFTRVDSAHWTCVDARNPVGSILMVPIVHAPDLDRPLGRSVLTPELLSVIDKAVRDVLRMDVGAEFFTAPQRYALGVADDLFSKPLKGDDGKEVIDEETGEPVLVTDEAKKLRAYLGSLWAFTRDENGDIPQVGQFPAGDADNFIRVYENDAQRFSGAANVPLAQLGVLSNNYTSSDALGAANDPLILDVKELNNSLRDSLWQIARLMMAVSKGITLNDLTPEQNKVRAYFDDPSMPTISARADAWTKIAAADPSVVGTRVFYEGMGLDQSTIDRLMNEREDNAQTLAYQQIFKETSKISKKATEQ